MARARLIVDTNILLLLVIGSVENGRHIRTSSRLNRYDRSDFEALGRFIDTFQVVSVTPYIATEVSNLIDLKGHARELAFEVVRTLVQVFEPIPSDLRRDIDGPHFLKFGITDAVLTDLVHEYTVLTDDRPLSSVLYAINEKNVVDFELVRHAAAG